MTNPIDIYMKQVDTIIKNTKDPFIQKYPKVTRDLIESYAKENWLATGDPILNPDQMSDVFKKMQEHKTDKSWEYINGVNMCMN